MNDLPVLLETFLCTRFKRSLPTILYGKSGVGVGLSGSVVLLIVILST